MKKDILKLLGSFAVGSVLVSGCYTRPAYEPVVTTASTGEVVVSEAPPATRPEPVGVAPDTSHVWIQGYWMYHNNRWVWIAGHWEVRPRVNALWMPGHWDHTARGWVWTAGHWE